MREPINYDDLAIYSTGIIRLLNQDPHNTKYFSDLSPAAEQGETDSMIISDDSSNSSVNMLGTESESSEVVKWKRF